MQYIKRNPSSSERFAQAFQNAGQAAGQAIPEYMLHREEKKLRESANARAEREYGVNLRGHTDKEREILLAAALKAGSDMNELEYKNNARKQLLQDIEGEQNSSPGQQMKRNEPQRRPGLQTPIQNKQVRNDILQEDNQLPKDPFLKAKKYAAAGEHDLATIAAKEGEFNANKSDKAADRAEAKFQKDRDFHTEVSRPIIEAANERLKSSSINKGLRNQQRRDIESGNTTGFFPFVVDRMGLESFRNPESARFSNEAKNLFVESLNDIPGARPNMFIERFLSSAQPQIGRSIESNLSVIDVADFVDDLRDEQARQEIQIAKEDREKYGYVKEDVSERARDRMGDFANRRQEKMAMDIQQRHEKDMSDPDLINELIGGKATPGSYVTPRTMKILFIKNGKDLNKAVQEAKSLGLVMPEYLE